MAAGRLVLAGCAFLAAVSAGCGASPVSPAQQIDQTVVLAPGQTVSISGTALHLGLVGVASDSRCPADAMCVWPGEAIVTVRVTGGSAASQDYRLSTREGANSSAHDTFLITLTSLDPYPFLSQPIRPDAYRATVRIASR